MFDTGMLILGLALAVYGATLLVDGGSDFARRFKISEVIIGAIIVGAGDLLSRIHRYRCSSSQKETRDGRRKYCRF